MCLLAFSRQGSGEDGRFFAALRMTGLAIAIGEMYRSDLRSALNDMLVDRQARSFPLSSRGGLGATSRNHFCFILMRSDGRAEEPQADEGSTAAWERA